MKPTTSTAGVIWITGFTSSGKTTVGRKVESLLRDQGVNTIFLDGDDLRSIFASRWGYEREDRIELARVYFRLCSHLAAQGCTVIISAIAMYSEVREWLRENVPGVFEVYLDVPDAERERRDAETKQIFDKAGDASKMYDLPDSQVVRIENFGALDADGTAQQIVSEFLTQSESSVDFGRTDHWDGYYSASEAPAVPSPFADFVNADLAASMRIVEIGCGNGRDASFFAREGHCVSAIDPSASAIEACRRNKSSGSIEYFCGTLPDIHSVLDGDFDVAYSRFVIHAMPQHEEEELLSTVAKVLKSGGRLYVECRSINDQMAREGEVISPTERIFGHYRRFIIRDEFEDRLEAAGFRIVSSIESKGLAVHGDDDPAVIRVVAERV